MITIKKKNVGNNGINVYHIFGMLNENLVPHNLALSEKKAILAIYRAY